MKPRTLVERCVKTRLGSTPTSSAEQQCPVLPHWKAGWRTVLVLVCCTCLLLGAYLPVKTQAGAPSGTTIGSFTIVDGPRKMLYLPYVGNFTVDEPRKMLYLPYVLPLESRPGIDLPSAAIRMRFDPVYLLSGGAALLIIGGLVFLLVSRRRRKKAK